MDKLKQANDARPDAAFHVFVQYSDGRLGHRRSYASLDSALRIARRFGMAFVCDRAGAVLETVPPHGFQTAPRCKF
jgi:hypothetical protein